MKVVIFSDGINTTTGYAKLTRYLAKGLKEAGHEIHCIGNDYIGIEEEINGIPFLPTGNWSRGEINYVQTIAGYLNRIMPDIFLVIGDPLFLVRDNIHRILPSEGDKIKKVVYAFMDSEGLPYGSHPILDWADEIIPSSEFTKQELIAEGYFRKLKDVIYLGIEKKVFFPVDEKKQKELKKKFGFKEDDFVLFNYARNIRRKRTDVLLEAFYILMKKYPEIKFYGNILDYKAEIKKGSYIGNVKYNLIDYCQRIFKRRHGIDLIESGNIRFHDGEEKTSLGFGVDDKTVGEFIQMADLVVSNTGGEGFNLLIPETWACMKPIIVPNNSTAPELIGKNERGWAVPCDVPISSGHGCYHKNCSPERLAKNIEEAYLDKDLRDQVAKAGYGFVSKFTWENFVNDWLKIIE